MAIDYRQRRKTLRESFAGRDILILSATNVPRNYAANVYPFHQDATFRYYTGLNIPDAAIILSADGRETLFVTKPDADDYIWTGAVDSPDVLAARSGIENVGDYETNVRSMRGWLGLRRMMRICASDWRGGLGYRRRRCAITTSPNCAGRLPTRGL